MEDFEGQELETQSDASSEASSELPSSEGRGNEGGEKSEPLQTKTEDTPTPFHEHPRFKEIVEQKNQALTAQKALEERYAQLEARFNQFSKPSDQKAADDLIEDLKKVDPRLASRLESFTKALPQIEAMQQQFQAYQQKQQVEATVSQINALHESNKVAPEMKSFINNELDRLYMQGQLKDVQAQYKNIFDTYNKFAESIKKAERESYVATKKVDSKLPTSQPKGKPVSHAPKNQAFSKDPEVARQQVVSRYLKSAKADSDL